MASKEEKDKVYAKLLSGEYHLQYRTTKRTRSDVWQHFGRIYDGEKCLDYVCCLHCRQVRVYPHYHKYGTSSMLHHACYKKFVNASQAALSAIECNVTTGNGEDPDDENDIKLSDLSNQLNSTSGSTREPGSPELMATSDAAILFCRDPDAPDEGQQGQLDGISLPPVFSQQLPSTSHQLIKNFENKNLSSSLTNHNNNAAKKLKFSEDTNLEKARMKAEISKLNAETEYWKALTIKVQEETKKVRMEQENLRLK